MKSTEKPARCTEKPAGIPKFRNFEFENSFRSKLPENREISAGIPFPVVTEIFFKNENVNPVQDRTQDPYDEGGEIYLNKLTLLF